MTAESSTAGPRTPHDGTHKRKRGAAKQQVARPRVAHIGHDVATRFGLYPAPVAVYLAERYDDAREHGHQIEGVQHHLLIGHVQTVARQPPVAKYNECGHKQYAKQQVVATAPTLFALEVEYGMGHQEGDGGVEQYVYYYAGIVAVGSEAAGHLQAVVYHQQHGGGHERPARFFVLAVDYGHLKA